MQLRMMMARRPRRPFLAVWIASLLLGLPAAAVAQVGAVLGTVTRAATGAPVTSGLVKVCDQATCTQGSLNAQGQYAVTVVPGTYVVFTSVNTTLIDEIGGGIPCPVACDDETARSLGAPIVVTAGGKVVRNFALNPTGTVTGRVLDASTGAPIANHVVRLVVRFGNLVSMAAGTTGTTGAFLVPRLGPGTFHAYTESAPPRAYADEIYPDIPCVGGCNGETAVVSGAPIVVTTGAVTSGVDIRLGPAARITGTVRDTLLASALQGVFVEAHTRVGATLQRAAAATTGVSGTYTLDGLTAGSYVVTASSSQHVDEVHANRPCATTCRPDEIGLGDAVTVSAGQTAAVDFVLDPGGSLSGMVTDAVTGTPIAADVQVIRATGSIVSSAGSTRASAGGLYKVTGLAPGTYFVIATDTTHAAEIFGGASCLPCSFDAIVAGQPVSVVSGLNTPGIDMAMDPGGTISGTVTTTPSNAAASDVGVRVFRRGAAPVLVAGVQTDTAGAYTLTRLPAGSYAVATAAPRLDNEVYNDIKCPGGSCAVAFAAANGTNIQVGTGATVNGINFSLGPATGPPGNPGRPLAVNGPGGVQFTWAAPQVGGVATSYLFDAGLAPGTTFATLPVATNSLFVPGVPPGTYYIRVRGVNAVGAGPASSELTLIVGAGGVVAPGVPQSVETLVSAGRLTMTWAPPSTGPVPSSYLLEVGSAVGLSNIAVVPVTGHLFQFDGVPPGYYFVRVRGVAAGAIGPPTRDVVMVAGNVAAPPGEPSGLSSRVALNAVTLTWRPPTFGPVTSYVLEAGTAPGLSNIAVFNTGTAATSLVVPGVPPGTYHLRLRAVNAQGTSPPSFDHVLVVP